MDKSLDLPGVIAPPPLIYGAAFVLSLVLNWLWPLPILGSSFALWPGIVLGAVAVGNGIWGRNQMVAAGTEVNPLRPATAIVTSGPFRFTRNPLYISITLLYIGLTLACDTWWGVVLIAPLLGIMHYGVILREERYLEQKFGDAYRQYRSVVRRYI